jgi:hypothetical protein
VIRRFLLLIAALAVLAGCRVDVGIDVQMSQNGSGTITVTAVADAAVVAAAPGLADDLRLDDVRAAGWAVEGPTATADGGLQLKLKHTFSTPEQATALLASINGPDGPLDAVLLSRDATESAITYTVSGKAGLEAGLASFADPELLAAAGAELYAAQIREADVDPTEAVTVTLTMRLPGEVESTTGEQGMGGMLDEAPDSTVAPYLTWSVPTDGSSADLATTTRESLERGGIWSPLASVALVALIAWLVLSVVLIALVVRRRRRVRRRNRRVTPSA